MLDIFRKKLLSRSEYKQKVSQARTRLASHTLEDDPKAWPCRHISSLLLEFWPAETKDAINIFMNEKGKSAYFGHIVSSLSR